MNKEEAITQAYNAVTGQDDEDWNPDRTLEALETLWRAAIESMLPLDSAPWLCERWRDLDFARSGTPTDDYNFWAPRKGYAQNKSRYGY